METPNDRILSIRHNTRAPEPLQADPGLRGTQVEVLGYANGIIMDEYLDWTSSLENFLLGY